VDNFVEISRRPGCTPRQIRVLDSLMNAQAAKNPFMTVTCTYSCGLARGRVAAAVTGAALWSTRSGAARQPETGREAA
jgi:hypothetical protein